jgi:type VI secretion system VgrG family protein
MNTPIFTLEIAGFSGPQPRVARFEGEERLTRPYRFEIDLVSDNDELDLDDLVGQEATFTLAQGEETRQVHGIVRQISAEGEAAGGSYAYRLGLVPRLALLDLARHNRSFGSKTAMTVIEVIEAVLQDPTGLAFTSSDYSFQVLDRAAYPPRDFWVQYAETDADFLHRLLEHWGIFYYFEQTEAGERVIFCDSTTILPLQSQGGTLPYKGYAPNPQLGGAEVLRISRTVKSITKSVHLKDYNAEHPNLQLNTSATVRQGSFGEYDEYAPHFLTTSEGDFLARVRSEEIGAERDTFDLRTTSPLVSAGAIFSLESHFRNSFNQRYIPVMIRHEGQQNLAGAFNQDSAVQGPGYHNTLSAIPATAAYRSPRLTPRPIMSGVMPAVVEVDESRPNTQRAAIDSQGRYKVAIDFDMSDNPIYERSPWLRRMQPYAGPDVGMHFPLLKQTEVMIGWMDGDPDRPIIVGAMPNAETIGPVAKTNHTENKLRTASGIAFVMNDGPGESDSSGGGSPSAGGAPASLARSPAAAEGDVGKSVYSALLVPSSAGDPPHYLRLGDIAHADGHEGQILGSSVFTARRMAHRGKALTNHDYAGIFSFTGQNRTSTIGRHETVSVGGDFRQYVSGTATNVIGGSRRAAASQDASGDTGGSSDGADQSSGSAPSTTPPEDVYTPARASTGTVVAVSTNTDAYVAYLNYVPLITFCDTMQASYTLGVSYTLFGGFASSVGIGGQFSTMQGGTAAVGANYAYSIGRSGGLSDGSNILDSSFSFYATEGSITLGCRPASGSPIMVDAAATAISATAASYTGAVVGEMGQGTVIAQESMNIDKCSILGVAAQGISATAAGLAYAASIATAKAYFSGTINTLTPPDVPGEPTLSISPAAGLTLTSGPCTVRVTEGGIFLQMGTTGISILEAGITLVCGATSLSLADAAAELQTTATTFTTETMEMTGNVTIDQDLSVLQDVLVIGGVAATDIVAG